MATITGRGGTITGTGNRPEPAEEKRRGGRPTRERAALLARDILEVATEAFLTEGYGATSIESVARRAGVSKRTLYSRFPDKTSLFLAVVRHIIDRLRPVDTDELFLPAPLARALQRLARAIVTAAMDPLALGLFRITVADAPRFPEVAATIATEGGGREAIARIAALLESQAAGPLPPGAAQFAAAQFLQMAVGVPQRRALGLGPPMSEVELHAWADGTARLFLDGWLKHG